MTEDNLYTCISNLYVYVSSVKKTKNLEKKVGNSGSHVK